MGLVTGVLSFFIAKIFRIAGAILAGWGLFRIIFLDAGLVVPMMLILVVNFQDLWATHFHKHCTTLVTGELYH